MWIVLRYKKKDLGVLVSELKRRFDNNLEIYNPKFKTKFKIRNKIIINELSLLDDYLFCYHINFNNPNSINVLKFIKGVKGFITGYESSQKDIKEFIYRCRKSENGNGYLTNKFYDFYENSKFRFGSGAFSNFIFKIIDLQKNKMNILIGNLKISTKKEKFIFKSIQQFNMINVKTLFCRVRSYGKIDLKIKRVFHKR